MNIQIKRSTDIFAALDIARKNPHYFNPEGLKKMEKDFKTGVLIGAYNESKIVGFVSFKVLNNQAVDLTWIAVEPEYQNKGIGTSLVNKGLELLPNKFSICQMKTLSEIDPDPEYARTRNFYKKLEFIPLETISPYSDWGKDNPCQIFIKIL